MSFLYLSGKGTRISKYLINHDKVYEAEITLGIKTDTMDLEGNIIERREVNKEILQKDNILKTLKNFEGEIIQVPPIYSSIKVKGRKLYEYARNDEKVDIPKRKITIYKIELNEINVEENKFSIIVSCSKGTYIRSLAEDIGKEMNSIRNLKWIKKIKSSENLI